MTVIAVVGATGQQGGAVARALLDAGARVRALVRDPAKARDLADRGAELVRAELADPDSLRTAFSGAQRVFAMTTPFGAGGPEAEERQGIALVDAAADAGVEHVVLNSVGGAERSTGIPHFESKRRVEEHLAASGLPATVVRPVFFMENLGWMAAVQDGEVVVRMPLPAGVPLQMIAVADIGTVSADVLLDPGRVPGGSIEIAGDERTGEQIAAAFGERAGRPGRYEAVPLDGLDDDARAMFTWLAHPPAYRGDIEATRALAPGLLDLPGWLATGWSPRE
ncbi:MULTISPECIES: NmrA/HSCARG family protein [unclassified Geodermatophilus]|uniref:NmrA/HSCARG family protein n=1 Tax=unclassified Geodermatophilus TaxID=2637632 RepID=UPI003EEE6EBC